MLARETAETENTLQVIPKHPKNKQRNHPKIITNNARKHQQSPKTSKNGPGRGLQEQIWSPELKNDKNYAKMAPPRGGLAPPKEPKIKKILKKRYAKNVIFLAWIRVYLNTFLLFSPYCSPLFFPEIAVVEFVLLFMTHIEVFCVWICIDCALWYDVNSSWNKIML